MGGFVQSIVRPRRSSFFATAACVIFLAMGASMALAGRATAAPMPGVQVHLLWGGVTNAEVDQQLDAARAANAGILRVDVGWSSLEETGKGQYESWYLDKIDNLVNQAQARGLKLLFTFWTTPCWASSAPDSIKQNCSGAWWDRGVDRYPPANPADYADAFAFLVRRYGDRVAAWEAWNEPNSQDFFKTSAPARDYAALVKAAYPAVKQANPRTTFIAGSLMESDYSFTEALYRDYGLKGYFDAFSVHPYSGDHSPLNPEPDQYISSSFIRGVPAVHDVMARHGDDKPLWLTEFGWSDCTVRDNSASWANCVDSSTQASYLTAAFAQMQTWSYVPVGIWFNLKNTSSDTSSRLDNYGLLRRDGSQKPAYAAFRDVGAGLANGTLPPPSGTGTVTGTGTTGAGGPATGSKGKKNRARILLRVIRRGGRVVAKGRAPSKSRLRLSAFRYSRRLGHFVRRPNWRKSVVVESDGHFAVRLRHAALRRGRWRIVASSVEPPVVAARSSLR